MRKKFGQVLLEQGLITPAQLADALTYQGRNGMRLGQALVARGHLTEDQLVIALGQALSTRVVDLSRVQPDSEALDLVRPALASEHDLFPIALREVDGTKELTVALADPLNRRGIDELVAATGAQIDPVLAKSTAIDMAIRRHYGPRLQHLYGAEPVDSYGPSSSVDLDATEGLSTAPATRPDTPMLFADDANPSDVHVLDVADNEGPTAVADPAEPADLDEDELVIIEPVLEDSALSDPAPEDSPGAAAPIPLTQVKRAPSGFDAELGALIEAAGDAVQEEAVGRLERRFWALMRVLAKKGLVDNEEFLRELNEEEATFPSS